MHFVWHKSLTHQSTGYRQIHLYRVFHIQALSGFFFYSPALIVHTGMPAAGICTNTPYNNAWAGCRDSSIIPLHLRHDFLADYPGQIISLSISHPYRSREPHKNKDYQRNQKYRPGHPRPRDKNGNEHVQKGNNARHLHVLNSLPVLFPIVFRSGKDPIVLKEQFSPHLPPVVDVLLSFHSIKSTINVCY